jgi:hypothetical protein
MKEHPAVLELHHIIQEENLELREESLKDWIATWLAHVEKTQYVVNKSVMSSDDTDFTWYKVAEMCAEELIDENISINTTTNNSFSCEVYALRSRSGKLKENTKGIKKAR